MAKIHRAFTLVEILIALIVVGVLAGMMLLASNSSKESAQKSACLGEMEKLKTQYAMQRFASGGAFKIVIDDILGSASQVDESNSSTNAASCHGLCESGGTYDIKPSSASIYVKCTIHGGEFGQSVADAGGGSEPSGGYYLYNTDNTIAIADKNYWTTQSDFLNATGTFKKGTVIYIEEKCYVAMADIDKASTEQWHTYINYGGFNEIPDTKVVVDYSQSKTYKTGDLCRYNGNYYVAANAVSAGNQWNSNDPESKPDSWIKLQ